MRILFTKHNVTIHPYLKILGDRHTVTVFHHIQAHVPVPENCTQHIVVYRPRFISDLFVKFSISLMYPQYIRAMSSVIQKYNPSALFISDISHFIFLQAIKYKRTFPATKLYIWSETRAWPQFFLSRWVMYAFWWYFKRNSKYVEKVFVFTEQGRQFFATNAPALDVEVLPAPIDTKQFYADKDKTYMPNGTLRIIMNARYIPLKEHRTFFRALAILKERGVPYSATLIGRGGHLEHELKEYAVEISVTPQLTWLAPVPTDELLAIYSTHDALVLASNREAIGMVVPEAMACGLATVTSEAVGANTYVKAGETGLLFETGNAEVLADALEKLADENVVRAYGQAAAREIKEKYNIDMLGEKLLQALE